MKKIVGLILVLVFLSAETYAQYGPVRASTLTVRKTSTFTGVATFDVAPVFSAGTSSTAPLDGTITNTVAAGDKAVNFTITQNATALTGNLIGGAFVATNGTSSGVTSGVLYGIEAKARAATSANVGAAISRLDGVYSSVDVKDKVATTIRAFEASLDGGAGGSSTEAVAFEAFNNSSATQTSSYAFSANAGTASGHKAYTADLRLQNGALINNSSTSLLTITEATVAIAGALTSTGGIDIGTSQAIIGTTAVTLGNNAQTVAINSSDWDIDATGIMTNIGTIGCGKVSSTGGVDLGTSQALTGTTALTIGSGSETVAVNSSDWDIDATGVMSGIGNIGSNGSLILSASVSGGITVTPIATGTAVTTIQNQNVAAATITLPSATTTLPGLGLANSWTAANTVNDDLVFALGTTATNGATQIRAEFDETTTGIGIFAIGDMTNPQVLNVNPGATVSAHTVNINHSAGAGDCDDLLGSYSKINVLGDGDAGITVVGNASRAYVGLTGGANNSVASQAYGTQAWAKHGGTGAITAMSGLSAKLDVGAENFTATTANAGHFHIDGAADVTGQFDGVMIEAYPDVDVMDALLALATDGGADVDAAIRITGAPKCQVLTASGAKIFTGTAANGDAIYAEVGAYDAIGSMYINATNGYLYIQVANAGAAADWYKVTAADVD